MENTSHRMHQDPSGWNEKKVNWDSFSQVQISFVLQWMHNLFTTVNFWESFTSFTVEQRLTLHWKLMLDKKLTFSDLSSRGPKLFFFDHTSYHKIKSFVHSLPINSIALICPSLVKIYDIITILLFLLTYISRTSAESGVSDLMVLWCVQYGFFLICKRISRQLYM